MNDSYNSDGGHSNGTSSGEHGSGTEEPTESEFESQGPGHSTRYKVARSTGAGNVVNTIDIYEDFPFSV